MRSEQLAIPQVWAEAYRTRFGLPRVRVTASGFVVLPLADRIAAVNPPEQLGTRMLGEPTVRLMPGPVREHPARRRVLAVFDGYPNPECTVQSERHGVDIAEAVTTNL